MSDRESALLRKSIAEKLAFGLRTQVEPFPETEKEFGQILSELRAMDRDDIEGKMVVSGFLDHPNGQMQTRCYECMYYLVNRKWCDLPELSLPVEPDWWCRLWRIWSPR